MNANTLTIEDRKKIAYAVSWVDEFKADGLNAGFDLNPDYDVETVDAVMFYLTRDKSVYDEALAAKVVALTDDDIRAICPMYNLTPEERSLIDEAVSVCVGLFSDDYKLPGYQPYELKVEDVIYVLRTWHNASDAQRQLLPKLAVMSDDDIVAICERVAEEEKAKKERTN